MAQAGESSSSSPRSTTEKPVIVRVKRKAFQSPLEAFWLEINERPVKRPLIDFGKLSISSSSGKEELKTRRVLVQHLETVVSSEASFSILQSFAQPVDDSKLKSSHKERRHTLEKEKIHDQLLSKAKQEQEISAKNARFEQIWRHRKGNKEAIHDVALDDLCRVYDVVRVDGEEPSERIQKQDEISVEDQEALSKFLPLLQECIPSAAEEIKSDLCSHASKKDLADEYVYDIYAVKDDTDQTDASHPFPLVQVDDDDEFYDGLDDSDYKTDDSNAEDHPWNDYPEEESDAEESQESSSESAESERESGSDTFEKCDDLARFDLSEDPLYVDEMNDDDHDDFNRYSDDSEHGEDWRLA